MTQTATLTPDAHRFRALARANEIRMARAELKRQIAAAEVILDPPSSARRWSVGELLVSQRGWGATRCRRFLARSQISERRTIGELTERQRHLLAAELRDFAPLSRA
jgi:hypothetical protein